MDDQPLTIKPGCLKRSIEDSASDVPASMRNKYSSMKYGDDWSSVSSDLMDDKNSISSISKSLPKDQKSHLKFKIPKNLNNGNQNALSLPGKDEITCVKGIRSERRRPKPIEDRASIEDVEDTPPIATQLSRTSEALLSTINRLKLVATDEDRDASLADDPHTAKSTA
ncbi:uncharacterized protein Fot_28454 [Forsythia ovata]|uniref:Uncharacterized protein n=1 Tax=Forsythia ovata TaxID=205694 RepID=A0ABD1TP19_9LAMI